ncbi:hypothetical protein [Facklamia lactis]|uniref:hypothetical protein n=1 Tax=Facklamia lactis TaxID=2749967 RepID=UPI0018CD2C10|nr:hypothetical protein [Facklamia lactis]MBG9979525.1 hypothetical protein [Facklamia lactis]
MTTYLKSELFRITKIKLFYFLALATVLTTLCIGFFFKSIARVQDFTIYGNHYLYACLMLLLVGFYLIYPFLITGHISKSQPLNYQIISNDILPKNIFLTDILLSSLIAFTYLIIFYLSSSVFARIFFQMNNQLTQETAYITELNYLQMMGVILLLIFTSISLLYGLQSITQNKIAATGIFIFISYIIPLIIAQLRMVSPFFNLIGNFLPLIQAFTFYRGESNFLSFLLVNLIWILLTTLIFNKKFVQQFI